MLLYFIINKAEGDTPRKKKKKKKRKKKKTPKQTNKQTNNAWSLI